MGMLNTLLPPMHESSKLPSPVLDHETLKEERDAFFDYIRLVEKNGPVALNPIVSHNAGPGDSQAGLRSKEGLTST